MKKTCRTCEAFAQDAPGSLEGECRMNAPKPVILGMVADHGANLFASAWPEVNETDWCLEWVPLTVVRGT